MSRLLIADRVDPTSKDVIWVAGFFDGEGCISTYLRPKKWKKGYNYRLRIVVTQRNQDILMDLAKWFGGGVYAHNNAGQFFNWQWQITTNSDMLKFLEAVTPYLRLKQEQAKLALMYLYLREEQIADEDQENFQFLHNRIKQLKVVA